MLKNTSDTFGSVAKVLHWLIAFGIIGMLAVGLIMVDMAPSPTKMMLYGLHKSTGNVILLLVVLRLAWRFLNPSPQLPASLQPWHHHLASLSPLTLYALMLLMPLSGIILSQTAGYPITIYNSFTLPTVLPKNLEFSKIAIMFHKYSAFTLIGILIFHVSAAIYHHYVLKTNVLQRMLPSWFQRS